VSDINNNNEPEIFISSASSRAVSTASIKGGFFQKTDLRLISIMLFSFFIHGVFIAYLRSLPVPKEKILTIEQIPERFAKLIMDKPIKKEKLINKGDKGKASASVEKEAKAAEKPAEGASSGPVDSKAQAVKVQQAQKAVAQRAVQAEKRIRDTGVFKMLSGLGGTARGPAVVDVLGKSGRFQGTGNLDDQLSGIQGLAKGVSSMDQPLVKSRGGGAAQKADISNLISELGSAQQGALSKRGNIVYRPPEIVGEATNTAKRAEDVIGRVVKQNITSISMSYEKELKKNPQLAGKITVKFTIEEDGSVSNVEIVETTMNSPDLESDIVRKIKRWTFEALSAGSGSTVVTYPFVFQPS